MPTLHIALQDGFKNHTVKIEVDGVRVYSQQGVSTDLRISLAASLDVEVAKPLVSVHVSVDPGLLTAAREVDVLATPYLLVSVNAAGAMQLTPTTELPLYM